MADINKVYAGTTDFHDPDVILDRICSFSVIGICVGSYTDIYLPDELRDKIRKANADAQQTTDAVKVPYTGLSQAERIAWLNERVVSINNRVAFIKARTDGLLSMLQQMSTDSYGVFTKLVTTALSFVPVVGQVATYAQNQVTQSENLEQFKLQSLIQDYVKDINQLVEIRTQLVGELKTLADPTDKKEEDEKSLTDKLYDAAKAVSFWWYAAGVVLVILIVYRQRNRRKSR